jgi:hypothetical protein
VERGRAPLPGLRSRRDHRARLRLLFSHEDAALGKPQFELIAAARDGHFEDEGWRFRKDGSKFWANVILTALRDPAAT